MIALVMEDYVTSGDNDASKMMESLLQLCENPVSSDKTSDISQVRIIFNIGVPINFIALLFSGTYQDFNYSARVWHISCRFLFSDSNKTKRRF